MAVCPEATVEVADAMAMEFNTAAVTVRVVLPFTVPEVAVIVAIPVALAVATPVVAPMEATLVPDTSAVLQVTEVVMLEVRPSE